MAIQELSKQEIAVVSGGLDISDTLSSLLNPILGLLPGVLGAVSSVFQAAVATVVKPVNFVVGLLGTILGAVTI